jgi:cellular nucleic acid-binding protein
MDDRCKKETLRQRGWSIQSEGTTGTASSERETLEVLQSMPATNSLDDHAEDHMPLAADPLGAEYGDVDLNSKKRPRQQRDEKRSADDVNGADIDTKKKPRLLDVAKQRLSKWASRLFDPNRPKGLIETPLVIPLNDTYLKAFGKREKEHDSRHGVSLEIETAHDHSDDEQSARTATTTANADVNKPAALALFKVKITNLKFTTTEQQVERACGKFGTIHKLDFLKNADNDSLNKGFAYCTFTTEEAAKECIDKLVELDGRRLRLFVANQTPANKSGSGASATSSRYYLQDLSTKCFRCGEVGHYAESCTNDPIAKPCPICSKTDHELRECPSKQVCFNCGLPGHVVRECRLPRGQPQRQVCTVCFWSGHTKENCRSGARDVSPYAICMVCGSAGHFMCRDMQWYFGLRGISCYNCGRTGHVGSQCDRPRSEECSRNFDQGAAEVERAAPWATAEDEIQRRNERGRQPPHHQDQRRNHVADPRRNNSMPPPQSRGRRDESGQYSDRSRSHSRSRGNEEQHDGGNRKQQVSIKAPPSLDQALSAPNKGRRR